MFIWPNNPLRISRSVGYGLRGSPKTEDFKFNHVTAFVPSNVLVFLGSL